MFFTTDTQLPTWAWILIGVLAVVGIVVGFWGFISGFKLFSHSMVKKEQTIDPLSGSKIIKTKDLEKLKNTIGVVGFYIDNKTEDFFKPVFVDTTEDISNWLNEIKNEIAMNETSLSKQVNEWLNEKEYKVDKINFVYISITQTIDIAIKQKEELLTQLNLSKRMFER